MDNALGDNALAASISALTGAVVSYVVVRYQTRAKFRGTVDASLICKRERLYQELWRLTSTLPRWPHGHACTYKQVVELGEAMSAWYFTRGGLYLSEQARDAYGTLRARIDVLADRIGVLSDAEYNALFDAATKLRTELTKDLFSRQRATG